MAGAETAVLNQKPSSKSMLPTVGHHREMSGCDIRRPDNEESGENNHDFQGNGLF
jgi:hypothetical protein